MVGFSRLLHVQVGLTGPMVASETRAEAVDADALNWRPAIHGGCGRIATRHIWVPGDFASSWTFLDHAVLEPGASVGYHYHDALEESFVVLGGRGRMTVADESFAVEPGSVTWQGLGQGHGSYHAAAEPRPNRTEHQFSSESQNHRFAVSVNDGTTEPRKRKHGKTESEKEKKKHGKTKTGKTKRRRKEVRICLCSFKICLFFLKQFFVI